MSEEQQTWDKYADWREQNDQWLNELLSKTNADGTPYYTRIESDRNPGAYVLMHFCEDPAPNAGKLSPKYTSTVDTRYILHLCNGTPVDSSTLITAYGKPGVYRARLNNLVFGWYLALSNMHCGDTAEVIVPYGVGYGAIANGSIDPYSNLRFNIRLVDIPYYEKSPY